MKRDMELVRLLLLEVEADPGPYIRTVPEIAGFEPRMVVHHVKLLAQAGLLSAVDASTMKEDDFIMVELTWSGHEFLESVRDPEIWQKTKGGAAKVGSWSLSFLGELAKAAVRAKAADLGLPIAG